MSAADDAVDITTRDGAIQVLRAMRASTTRVMLTDPNLTHEDQLNEVFAQLYGITVILGGILGDPELKAELDGDIEKVEEAIAQVAQELRSEQEGGSDVQAP